METLKEKIRRVTAEEVDVVPVRPRWPILFEMERNHLRACLPRGSDRPDRAFRQHRRPGARGQADRRHPGRGHRPGGDQAARSSRSSKAQGYDYFWRPSCGDDQPPFYAWFIKRDAARPTDAPHPHGRSRFRALGPAAYFAIT